MRYPRPMRLFLAASAFIALALASAAAPPGAAPAMLTPAEKSAARQIRPEVIRAHVRFLASDLLEGRGPATRGDRLAEEYVATRMETLGLEPAAPGGGWLQPFDVIGITSQAPAPTTSSSSSTWWGPTRPRPMHAASSVQRRQSRRCLSSASASRTTSKTESVSWNPSS